MVLEIINIKKTDTQKWWMWHVMNVPDDERAGDESAVMNQPWWMSRVMNCPATETAASHLSLFVEQFSNIGKRPWNVIEALYL